MSIERLFDSPLKVVNVGLRSFAEDLRTVGVECQHVTITLADAGDGPPAEDEPRQTDTGKE